MTQIHISIRKPKTGGFRGHAATDKRHEPIDDVSEQRHGKAPLRWVKPTRSSPLDRPTGVWVLEVENAVTRVLERPVLAALHAEST